MHREVPARFGREYPCGAYLIFFDKLGIAETKINTDTAIPP